VKRIDVLKRLVRHPMRTFQMGIRGDSMREEGIVDEDIAFIIDRAITPATALSVVTVIGR
jgi:SOS-response transcriptional repressor LexA